MTLDMNHVVSGGLEGINQAWARVPALVRGPGLAISILILGQLPPGVFLVLGLRLTPTLPWFLAATLIWLLVYWSYLNGRWPPPGTTTRRRQLLRGGPLAPQTWLYTLLTGAFGMSSVLTVALLTGLVVELPPAAYDAPIDLSPYPWWTTLAVFVHLALVAGVVEEAAFRGYMLSIVQQRHGWAIGILSVALLFYAVHRSHAYATLEFLPFFLAYSLLHGLLVCFTGSILPSVGLHAVGDLVILPIQYGVVADPLGDSVAAHLWAVVGFGALTLLAMWRLAAHCATHIAKDRAALTEGQ